MRPTWKGRWYSADSFHLNRQEGGGPGSHRHLPERDNASHQEAAMLKPKEERCFVFSNCAILIFPLHLSISDLFLEMALNAAPFLATKKSHLFFFLRVCMCWIRGTPACFPQTQIHAVPASFMSLNSLV